MSCHILIHQVALFLRNRISGAWSNLMAHKNVYLEQHATGCLHTLSNRDMKQRWIFLLRYISATYNVMDKFQD